jgi:hypothetical protein
MLTVAGPPDGAAGIEWGWEEWEDLDYYDDLECAKSDMLDLR